MTTAETVAATGTILSAVATVLRLLLPWFTKAHPTAARVVEVALEFIPDPVGGVYKAAGAHPPSSIPHE